ncbi:MAG: GNAT family N-acetyltransferase [Jiangellaceae bacterium]|nr:GNAT family N-acetyltransferase [Jiangellaceae bacterium]
MAALRTVHTADLDTNDRHTVRQLLDAAYDDDFADEDWDHTLGGMHVLAAVDGAVVAHVAVVQRRLWHRGMSIRTGYVEALAVGRDRRRQGVAAALMGEAERLIRSAYDLGALSDGTNIEGFYERRGWQAWHGCTSVISPTGVLRTEEDDETVMVLPTPTSPSLDVSGLIACDWRPGDVW